MGCAPYQKFINCLLIFTLACMQIIQGQLFKGIDQYYASHIAPLPSCLLTNPAANAAACTKFFTQTTSLKSASPPHTTNLTKGPASQDTHWKIMNDKEDNFNQAFKYSDTDNQACNDAIAAFSEINDICTPFLHSIPIDKFVQEIYLLNKPLIDISCNITQLGVAQTNDTKIFLPGCTPESAGADDQCLNSPIYWQAFDLLNSYGTGYVYKYPNPADGFSMLDYIATWVTAQMHAQNNTDQAGQPITPQINLFDPNSFLNSTNNIQSRVATDLNSALQTALNLLTNPANHFPSDNLAKLNGKTSVTCNPNLQCDSQDTTCIPCCEVPTMSYTDAQAFLMNGLHNKLTDLYNFQEESAVLKNMYRPDSGIAALDKTKIPDLAIVDPVAILNVDTTTEINGQPIPLAIGKVLTNWPEDPKFLDEAVTTYIQYSVYRTIAENQFTTKAGEKFYCDPMYLMDKFMNTTNLCNLAAVELGKIREFESTMVSIAIFIVIFAVTEGLAVGLAGMIDVGLGLEETFTTQFFMRSFFQFYNYAMLIPMAISLSRSPEATGWFNSLPKALRDVWAPPLGLTFNNNISILEANLACELSEYLAALTHTTAEPCRVSDYTPVEFG